MRSAAELEAIVVAQSGGSPVRLADVARVVDGPEEPVSYVTHGEPGSAAQSPAVTLSVSKRRGANAITVAAEKSNELLVHMGLAVLFVTGLIAFALGPQRVARRLIAIPVTLALTLLVFYLYGYTLNRITLFALIFSIGILVDDAIVVVENIVRHYGCRKENANRRWRPPSMPSTKSATRPSSRRSQSSRPSCRWRSSAA